MRYAVTAIMLWGSTAHAIVLPCTTASPTRTPTRTPTPTLTRTFTQTPTSGAGATPGSAVWARHFGTSGINEGRAVAVDSSGNVVITGTYNNSIDLGGGTLPCTSGGIFLAKYTSAGTHVWSKCFGGYGTGLGVAIDSAGNISVTGNYSGTADFGGGPITSSSFSIFVAKYDANGTFGWAKRLGTPYGESFTRQSGRSVAMDSNGAVLLAGNFAGNADFGEGTVSCSVGYCICVVKYAADGTYVWSKTMGGTGTNIGWGITTDVSNNVFVTGNWGGTTNFGGGAVTAVGAGDAFLVKYTSAGTFVWLKDLGAPGGASATGTSVAVGSNGNIALTGYFTGTISFGGASLTSLGQTGNNDIFVVLYATDGGFLWNKRAGDIYTSDRGGSVALDTNGNVGLTGFCQGTVDFGVGTPETIYSVGIFIVKYSSIGTPLWAHRYSGGDGTWSQGTGIAVDRNNNYLVTTGLYGGVIDFGTGPLIAASGSDIYLVRLVP